ncbi:MAG: hypothetical protein MUO41_09945 [Methyloceanibacter sp.]|nr:hypothetical protein [Methyloceanibacter sp.]
MLQKLWYERPVRTQLLAAVGVINLLAALLAGAVSILNTRTATRVEIEASLEVAQRLVAATMRDLAVQDRLTQLNQELPLELKHLRHVRIMFMDPVGQLTVVSPQSDDDAAERRQVPRWFSALVRSQLVGRAVRVVSLDHANPVIIVGEPADEIAEAWHLGGTCVIESAPSKGTIIHVEIPVERASAARARAPELVGGLS